MALLHEERWQPGNVCQEDQAVDRDERLQTIAMEPERPHRLDSDDEDGDVMAVDRRHGGDDVDRPPPAAAGIQRSEEAERRERREQRDGGIGPVFDSVEDRERAEGNQRSGDQPGGTAGDPLAKRVRHGNERDPAGE